MDRGDGNQLVDGAVSGQDKAVVREYGEEFDLGIDGDLGTDFGGVGARANDRCVGPDRGNEMGAEDDVIRVGDIVLYGCRVGTK